MNYAELKDQHRNTRDNLAEGLNLRVHRALSWLQRSEQCGDDADAQFIFLWIAFNAAYASEFGLEQQLDEQRTFREFIDKLISLDRERKLEHLVWQEFSGSIRVLIDNRYVAPEFWLFHRAKISESQWQERFAKSKSVAGKALGGRDTATVLSIALSRAYVLRNQLIHGGATWNSAVNREQVRDCAVLMGVLVPMVVELMLNSGDTLWGDACYPVLKG